MDLIFVSYLSSIINNWEFKCFITIGNIVFIRGLFPWAGSYTIKNWPMNLSGRKYVPLLKTKINNGYP